MAAERSVYTPRDVLRHMSHDILRMVKCDMALLEKPDPNYLFASVRALSDALAFTIRYHEEKDICPY
jgi:hypothetical protein